ncbi:putative SP-containing protein [Vairimorpha necatrix]|uniref:SP-containing protein n=1 Tax=Vairimorpha necatrix TaxID=6039 RepID=A0AAX4JDT8_9MICR
MMYLIPTSIIIQLMLLVFIPIEATKTIIYSLENNIESDTYKYKEIAKILFAAVLEKIKFPYKKRYLSSLNLKLEYAVELEDMKVNKYIEGLENLIDISNYAPSKERLVLKLHLEISKHTKLLFQTLLCINYKTGKLELPKVKNILDKHVEIMSDATNPYFKQIFSKDALKRIIDDIYDTTGYESKYTTEMRKVNDSMNGDINIAMGQITHNMKDNVNNVQLIYNNSYKEDISDKENHVIDDSEEMYNNAGEDISDEGEPNNDDRKEINNKPDKDISDGKETDSNDSEEIDDDSEEDISDEKFKVSTQESSNSMKDNKTFIENEKFLIKQENESPSSVENKIDVHQNVSLNGHDNSYNKEPDNNSNEEDISTEKLNMNAPEGNNNMVDNTNFINEDHMDKQEEEEERISRLEKHLNMFRKASSNIHNDVNNSAITFESNSSSMLISGIASLLVAHQLGNNYLLN